MLDYFVKMSTCFKRAKAKHDLIKKSVHLSLNKKVHKTTHDEHHLKVVFAGSYFFITCNNSNYSINNFILKSLLPPTQAWYIAYIIQSIHYTIEETYSGIGSVYSPQGN